MAERRIKLRLPRFWHEDRFLSFFLALLVLMTIFVPMFGQSRAGRIAIDLIFALMLLSGAIAIVRKRTLMYLIMALTILEFTADLLVEFDRSFSLRGGDTALKLAARGGTSETARAVTKCAAPESGCHSQASRAIWLLGKQTARHPA